MISPHGLAPFRLGIWTGPFPIWDMDQSLSLTYCPPVRPSLPSLMLFRATRCIYWGALARRVRAGQFFFLPFPTRACFCPHLTNNLEYLLAVSKNLAHPLHPVYDHGKGGGWKWWEWHFVLLNSHISAYTRCLTEKVCGLVRPTWGTSQGQDKLGARDKILNTKVACRANIPPMCILK